MEKYIVLDIETMGLTPCMGHQITCICAKDHEDNWFYDIAENEPATIGKFLRWIEAKPEYKLITANGIEFDVSFIIARAMIHGVPYETLKRILLHRGHTDVMAVTPKKISVENLAIVLNCTRKSGSGYQAILLFQQKKYNELIKYCSNDVRITEEIYHKLNMLREVKNEKKSIQN